MTAVIQTGLSCVHYAAQGGHISTVMALLESRCDIEAVTKDGSTALHLAAAQGHATVVEWLVGQAGLKVTSVNKKRQTALDLARKAGHKATAQFLVQVSGLPCSFPGPLGGQIVPTAVANLSLSGLGSGASLPVVVKSWGNSRVQQNIWNGILRCTCYQQMECRLFTYWLKLPSHWKVIFCNLTEGDVNQVIILL